MKVKYLKTYKNVRTKHTAMPEFFGVQNTGFFNSSVKRTCNADGASRTTFQGEVNFIQKNL